MHKNLFRLTGIMVLFMTVLVACNKDDENNNTNNQPANEYVATDDSFADFKSWTLETELQGPDPALGEAHHGNNDEVKRFIYFKNDQDRVNGKYPTGTIIVKESKNPDLSVHELTAMVKRGNNFNPSGNDWEW